ncbi:hypothetical protein NPIL_479511, partial [Nephila pilipes]
IARVSVSIARVSMIYHFYKAFLTLQEKRWG